MLKVERMPCGRRDVARRMETQSHAAWLLQKIGESSGTPGANASFAASAQAIATSASQLSASYASGAAGGAQPLPPLAPAAMFRSGGGSYGQPGAILQQQQQPQQHDGLTHNELSVSRTWDVVARVLLQKF